MFVSGLDFVVMLAAVGFNDKPRLQAAEVDEVGAELVLSAEFEPVQAAIA
jgi:hypothetical protein